MTVFVSPVERTVPAEGWPYESRAVMVSDNGSELHAIGLELGLDQSWARRAGSGNVKVYWLTAEKRAAAVRRGARPLDAAGFEGAMKRILADAAATAATPSLFGGA
ncbi:MAG: DUF4031 domain-containing protein [Phycisphaerales bacterium]